MPVSITENNTLALRSVLNRLAKDLEAEVAAKVAETAKDLAPVKSGNLRESISATENGEVVTTANYYAEVEYGTSTTPAQPFVTPAAEQVATEIPAVARAAARRAGLKN